jgi:hypothetical protein
MPRFMLELVSEMFDWIDDEPIPLAGCTTMERQCMNGPTIYNWVIENSSEPSPKTISFPKYGKTFVDNDCGPIDDLTDKDVPIPSQIDLCKVKI